MRVSVVMPAFNRAWIIGEALRSVFAQTLQDFEVLVIDDGSTDNTAEVVKSFTDWRLRYIKKEQNAGCGAAYNTGIRAATGDYVSILDSDDLWKPDKLEREVRFLDTHPEVQAVFSDLEKVDRGEFTPSFMRQSPNFSEFLGKESSTEGMALGQRQVYLCLLREVFVKTIALTFRKEALLKTNLFDESWPSGNDWKLLLEFSKTFRFGYIDWPLAVIRVQGDATHWRHMVRDKMLTIEMLRNEIKTSPDDKAAVKSAQWGISNLSKHLSWYYLGQRRRGAAARALFQGFGYTHDFGLLTRAFIALLPQPMRIGAKRLLHRNIESMPTDR
ncbi:MAG TPA: glycosyltransferase family 2 protein [Candidatus Acidoferrales bacterium]|nr:glycosyltransferase family 2 protein [Candidatus Acidoferrales bacterium]